LEIAQALLKSYPSAAQAMTRKQDSALSLACTSNKSVGIVKLLIEANPQALIKKNDYGFAPIHCVCRAYQPRMGIVQALLDACPSCVHLKTNAGETPVHLASNNNGAFVGVLQLLTMAQNHAGPTNAGTSNSNPLVDAMMNDDEAVAGMYALVEPGAEYRVRRAMNTSNPNSIHGRSNTTTNKVGNTPCEYNRYDLVL
jgi:hypothetical protein